jgi:hypothetical protein
MKQSQAILGTRVKTNQEFYGVPLGTEGVIDEDYGTGVMVAWDLSNHPLPEGYHRHDGRPAVMSGILRDGFDKRTELDDLEVV